MNTKCSLSISLALILFSAGVFAQAHNPEKLKTKNNDLRGEKVIFSIESNTEDVTGLSLIETASEQFMMDFSDSKTRLKVSNDFAREADKEFVKDFIDLKYSMQKVEGKCEKAFTLEMRGEKEDICKTEKKRFAKVKSFVWGIKDKLKIK